MAKKIALMVLVVMLAVAYFTTDSNAAGAWYGCRVNAVGPNGDIIIIQLTDNAGSFTGRWFSLPPEKAKEMLALALTAMTNGWTVSVYTDTAISGGQIVSFMIYH